jgi:hypothetical protein
MFLQLLNRTDGSDGMAETSWPTNAGSGIITQDQWELLAQAFAVDGIIGAPTDTSPIFADSTGRQVKIRANKIAVVAGSGWSSGSTDLIKPIGANVSGSTRIDLVVLQLDRSTRAITCVVKAGTPGAGLPALTRVAKGSSSSVWEIPLAKVTVVNNAATINSNDVTNLAWYAAGESVVTTSTNPLQPPVGDYRALRHHDTDNSYVATSGAWRHQNWPFPWGPLGGKLYTGTTNLGFFFGSNGDTQLRTGNVNLIQGRRYLIEANFPLQWSATNDVYSWVHMEVRAGATAVIDSDDLFAGPVTEMNKVTLRVEYEPAGSGVVDFQLWGYIVRTSGTQLNWAGVLRSTANTWFKVSDIGPAGILTVNAGA